MSGLGIGPILTRPSNWVQGVPEWPLPGSEMFFFGHGGLWRSPAYLHTRPPNGPPLGPLWRRIFWPHGNVHGGATTPFGWGFRKNFIFRKKYFFLLRLGWYVAAAGLQSTFNQHPPCPISTNAPWGFCRLKRAPRRPWKVRGSTTMCALSAFQASEMGLTGDVG